MVFLSYNRRDREQVQAIRQALEAAGLRTFLDDDLRVEARLWPEALESRLAGAEAVVVFVGPHGLGIWQRREMYIALAHQAERERAGGGLRVIPGILPRADVTVSLLFLNTAVDVDAGNTEGLIAALRGTPAAGVAGAPAAVCPYRGLLEFREEHAGLFFGREGLVAQALRKLETQPLLGVVGPSGSGKSSFVLAGVVPALRQSRPPHPVWEVVRFRPGGAPWRMFADGLRELLPEESGADLAKDLPSPGAVESAVVRGLQNSSGSTTVLVVVDQFEELFTLSPDEDRKPFVEGLLAGLRSGRMKVILTLRADYYGRAIEVSRALSDLLMEGQINLGALDEEQLRQAIEKPAQRVGLKLEAGLVDLIYQQVRSEPGNLALLEFALTELWNKRPPEGGLTVAAYLQTGGVIKAIQQRLDDLYTSFDETRQRVVRELMTRLVYVARTGDEGADARRRVTRKALPPEAWPVVELLASRDVRLLVVSYDSVRNCEQAEFAHEAVLRHWEKIRDWIRADRDFLCWRQDIGAMSEVWHASQKGDTGALLPESKLSEAHFWWHRKRESLNEEERAFIRASLRVRGVRRTLRRVAAAAAIVAALVLGAGWWYRSTDFYQMRRLVAEMAEVAQYSRDWEVHRANMVVLTVWGGYGEAAAKAAKLATPGLRFKAQSIAAQWALRTRGAGDGGPLRDLVRQASSLPPADREGAVEHCFDLYPRWSQSKEAARMADELMEAAGALEPGSTRVTLLLELIDAHPRRDEVLRRAVEAARSIPDAPSRIFSLLEVNLRLRKDETPWRRALAEAGEKAWEELPVNNTSVQQGVAVAEIKRALGDQAGAKDLILRVAARLPGIKDEREKRSLVGWALRLPEVITTPSVAGVLKAEAARLGRDRDQGVFAGITVVSGLATDGSQLQSRRVITDLPINGRRFQDFAAMTPGMLSQPLWSAELAKAIHGELERTVFDRIAVCEGLVAAGRVEEAISYGKATENSDDRFTVLLAGAKAAVKKGGRKERDELVRSAYEAIDKQNTPFERATVLLKLAKVAQQAEYGELRGLESEALAAARRVEEAGDAAEVISQLTALKPAAEREAYGQEAVRLARAISQPDERAVALARAARAIGPEISLGRAVALEAKEAVAKLEGDQSRWETLRKVAIVLAQGGFKQFGRSMLEEALAPAKGLNLGEQRQLRTMIGAALSSIGDFQRAMETVAPLDTNARARAYEWIAVEYARQTNPVLERYLALDEENEVANLPVN